MTEILFKVHSQKLKRKDFESNNTTENCNVNWKGQNHYYIVVDKEINYV